jgi:hypothetical protein
VNIKPASARKGGVCISKAGERFYVHTRIIFESDSSSAAFINLIAKACDFISGPARVCVLAPKEARLLFHQRVTHLRRRQYKSAPSASAADFCAWRARLYLFSARSRGGENEMCLST